jgi:hypothetical protein
MIEKILLALAIQLIEKIGPMLIDIIIKWLQELTQEQKVALLTGLSEALKKQVA